MNVKKISAEEVARRLALGRIHLELVAEKYRKLIRAGRYFLHEHPSGALSWKEASIQSIRHLPEVATTKCDQCVFGCIADSDKHDVKVPAMKPTRLMSKSAIILEQVTKTCDRRHAHTPLHGKDCEMAAYDPLPFIRAIITGICLHQATIKTPRSIACESTSSPTGRLCCSPCTS